MEYFTMNGEGENLTLQDMIECDIKSEFSEQCESTGQVDLGLKLHFTEPVSVADAMNMDFSSQTTMSVDTNTLATLVNVGTDGQQRANQDMSWLQTVNVSDIQAIVIHPSPSPNPHQHHLHHHENSNDASLLVNPQTGLPVQPGLQSPRSQSAILPQVAPPSPAVTTVIQPMSPMSPNPVSASVATTNALLNSPVHNNINRNQYNIVNNPVSQATILQPQVTHVYQHPLTAQQLLVSAKQQRLRTEQRVEEKSYPKPVYSYSCLIAMALKNSETGALPVSEIYSFMIENFPYFKTAPDGWKNSVRHNLSLNKCFEKIENPKANGNTRKGCLWGLNPLKIEKMDEEITKWRKKDPMSVKRSMAKPEVLEMLEMGRLGSSSPRHPNNIKNLKNNNHINGQFNGVPQSPSRLDNSPMANPANVINIQPVMDSPGAAVKVEPRVIQIVNPGEIKFGTKIKVEDDGSGAAEADLNIMDVGLSLDSQLPDLNLQGNLWDELGAEGINLDDITASSLNFSFASVGSGTASPVNVQSVNASPLVTLLTNRTVSGSPSTIPINRTLFAAQT